MKKLTLSLIAVLALVVFMGAGCSFSTSTDEEGDKEAATEEKVTEYDSNWTSKIDKSGIAETDVTGKINEKDVTIADIQIKKWDGEYSWSFSNLAPDETCGVVIDNDAVNFSSNKLETGTFEKKMENEIDFDNYHAYYHYEQADGTPMSVNVGWSAKIVVDEIDEANKKVTGYAKVDFDDGKSAIDGKFEADLCE
jgi:hypothetical protein